MAGGTPFAGELSRRAKLDDERAPRCEAAATPPCKPRKGRSEGGEAEGTLDREYSENNSIDLGVRGSGWCGDRAPQRALRKGFPTEGWVERAP